MKTMDSMLEIRYHIYDVLGDLTETDLREEALVAFEKGRIVYEVHETTWSTTWTSGKHIVHHEWN